MSRRCKTGQCVITDRMIPTYPRTIGEMVRQARDEGVLPDMDTVPGAFDDDGEQTVDPHSDPRTDPMELLEAGQLSNLAALRDLQQSPIAPAAPVAPAESSTTE